MEVIAVYGFLGYLGLSSQGKWELPCTTFTSNFTVSHLEPRSLSAAPTQAAFGFLCAVGKKQCGENEA